MNILVFSPDAEKLKIISFALEGKLGLQVLQADGVEKAFELLLGENAVDLLVIGHPASTPLFVKYLASLNSKIPVILVHPDFKQCGARFSGINVAAQLSDETLLQDLPALIGANYRLQSPQSGPELDFCRISVDLLTRVSPLRGDVYVRLSSLKFVKLFNADAAFSEDDLARVWGVKKIDYLYIKKESVGAFVQKLQHELSAMMRATKEGDDSLLATVAEVQATIQSLAQKTGITEQVIKLTNTHVDFALKVIGRTPQLRKVMSNILSNRGGYIANHSVQVAHIACCIAAKMNWPSNVTFQKLIFAAFIHDLSLSEPHHARVGSKADLEKARSQFAEVAVRAIQNHPVEAAELAQRFSQVPSDVHQIILQHHERADGSGFPRGLSGNNIAPLAAVFIVAHEIADAMEDQGSKFKIEEFWAQHTVVYSAGTFRSIVKAFTAPGANDEAA